MQSQVFSRDWTRLSLQQNYVAFSSHIILTIVYTYTHTHTHTQNHSCNHLQSCLALSNYRSFESILSTYFTERQKAYKRLEHIDQGYV